jgi:hypothetical protein
VADSTALAAAGAEMLVVMEAARVKVAMAGA